MATGFLKGTVDLDDIFDLYAQGTQPAATGYKVGTVDLNQRYAPLVYGTQAPVTGMKISGGADLNTLWAAKGTAVYTITGLDGKFISAGDPAHTGQATVNAVAQVTIKNDGTWQAYAGNSFGPISLAAPTSGTWLPPGGVVSDYEVKFGIVITTVNTAEDLVVSNSAPAYSVCSTTRSAALTLPDYPGNNSHDRDAMATVTIRIRKIGSTAESVTNCTLDVNTNGYV